MSTKNKGEHNFSLQAFGHRAGVYAIGNITVLASPFLLIPLYTHFMPRTEYGLLATLLLSGNFLTLLLIIQWHGISSFAAYRLSIGETWLLIRIFQDSTLRIEDPPECVSNSKCRRRYVYKNGSKRPSSAQLDRNRGCQLCAIRTADNRSST